MGGFETQPDEAQIDQLYSQLYNLEKPDDFPV
jgi:hypothetical protein